MSVDKSMNIPGVTEKVKREAMTEDAIRFWDAYEMKPNAPLSRREFCLYSVDEWKRQGSVPQDIDYFDLLKSEPFMLDEDANVRIGGVGWTEAAFFPAFPEKILEQRGKNELIQDAAGRQVLMIKGRRSGFMPEYVDHPVKDQKTWEEDVKWRLDPSKKERYVGIEKLIKSKYPDVAKGGLVTQRVIGGYMYLRSLIGPEDLFYMVADDPELIHECMKAWFDLADAVLTENQKYISFDEIFFGEDICYNNGLLISPDMIREYLFPYYQQLIANFRSRQIDKSRRVYVQLDTDGKCMPAIDLYMEGINVDAMSPFEVASGCDVVDIAKKYPDLRIFGGIDKRILATTPEKIEAELQRIIPFMKKRGGYIPTCDHGVPEEVSYENYCYYRKRCAELGS